MYLLAKTLHIAAVTLWFGGLFLLPTLLASRARSTDPDADVWFIPVARRLYFHLMTPAAALAVIVGGALVAVAPAGAWLPAKLIVVVAALALHVYLGLALFDLSNGHIRHRRVTFALLGWAPLVLAAAILTLTATKPLTLAPADPITVLQGEHTRPPLRP